MKCVFIVFCIRLAVQCSLLCCLALAPNHRKTFYACTLLHVVGRVDPPYTFFDSFSYCFPLISLSSIDVRVIYATLRPFVKQLGFAFSLALPLVGILFNFPRLCFYSSAFFLHFFGAKLFSDLAPKPVANELLLFSRLTVSIDSCLPLHSFELTTWPCLFSTSLHRLLPLPQRYPSFK